PVRERARSPDLARRLRPPAHHGGGREHVPAAGAPQGAVGGGAHRRARPAPARDAHEPQPAGHDRDRQPRAPAPLPRGPRRCRRARAQLTRLSPDRESGGATPRSERDLDRDHGLREGHRGALRRAALPVQRLPARQLGRTPVRRRLAGRDARARVTSFGAGAGGADHHAVAAPLERRWRLEARLPRSREADPREARRAPPGVRRGEGRREDQARGVVSKPFAGIRIIDFTRYLAGPYGTYQLALLGADVVKIESHEGDDTRGQLADPKWAERKMAPCFLAVNGNKRSITLDLRRPEAVAIVKRLAVGADVVWENFRGGVMDRLGLGYEALSAANPRLIYCAVSGFGQTGPERTTAAFDGKLQAMSGIIALTGEPAPGPTRAGVAICATMGGLTAALAVASALFQPTHTGRGQFVDVAMLDAALAFLPGPVSEYPVAGIPPRPLRNGSGEPRA